MKNIYIIFLIVVVASCENHKKTEKVYSLIDKYNFEEANSQRELLKESIFLTNNILSPSLKLRLTPSWNPPQNNEDGIIIPVFLLKDENRIKRELAFVPNNEEVICINEKNLISFLRTYCDEDTSGKLSVDYKEFLSVILLHEVGHIFYKDNGNFDIKTGIYNVSENESKNKELRADKFVADQIKAAVDTLRNHFLDASFVSMSVGKLSWNLSNIRIIDNFGIPDHIVFWDDSESHPNLELRMLVIQNEILDSSDSEILVEDFMERRNSATPEPLYQQKD